MTSREPVVHPRFFACENRPLDLREGRLRLSRLPIRLRQTQAQPYFGAADVERNEHVDPGRENRDCALGFMLRECPTFGNLRPGTITRRWRDVIGSPRPSYTELPGSHRNIHVGKRPV